MTENTTKPQNKRAVIYCRVSTKEQVDEGNSLVSQERLCREYAAKEGYEVVEAYIEKGESAKTANRKELQRMLAFCTTKKSDIQALIAYKVDRISRNLADYSHIKVRLNKFGVSIKSVTELFEDTPAGRFMENIIANVSQFDNEVRTERSINGMVEAAEQEGRYVWKAPYGYDNAKVNGKSTIIKNHQAEFVNETFQLIAKGLYSTEEIRLRMADKGMVTNNKKPVNPSNFYRLIRNPTYKGVIKKFGKNYPGKYDPIVSPELFDLVQRILKRQANTFKFYNKENADFPLRQFITDPDGTKLIGYWAKGKLSKYPYYSFRRPKTTISKQVLEEKFVKFLSHFAFDTYHINQLKFHLQKQLDNHKVLTEKSKDAINREIAEVNTEIDNLIKLAGRNLLNDTLFQQKLKPLEIRIEELSRLRIESNSNDIKISEIMRFASELLVEPQNIWINGDLKIRRLVQKFVFPNGVIFDGQNCRTPNISNVFKLKLHFNRSNIPMVPHSNIKKNTLQADIFTSLSPDIINTKEFSLEVCKELREVMSEVTFYKK